MNARRNLAALGFKPVGPAGHAPNFWRNEVKGVCIALENGAATFRAYFSNHPSQDFVATSDKGRPVAFRTAIGAAERALT